ncbi:hypothetical protein NDU88_004782 [Pleurodeles waltl]|uniref:Uncharacterized protein n=1 Tax=Pleurodeles waltl TaxID=8319 RepID=A0AAV7T928_PLEWA|nr:hypothetical protein NDU88_004782 [Pleurodeles waltl]
MSGHRLQGSHLLSTPRPTGNPHTSVRHVQAASVHQPAPLLSGLGRRQHRRSPHPSVRSSRPPGAQRHPQPSAAESRGPQGPSRLPRPRGPQNQQRPWGHRGHGGRGPIQPPNRPPRTPPAPGTTRHRHQHSRDSSPSKARARAEAQSQARPRESGPRTGLNHGSAASKLSLGLARGSAQVLSSREPPTG